MVSEIIRSIIETEKMADAIRIEGESSTRIIENKSLIEVEKLHEDARINLREKIENLYVPNTEVMKESSDTYTEDAAKNFKKAKQLIMEKLLGNKSKKK